MKILLSIPGHLKTVPMSDYVSQTLKAMGHDIKLFNFGAHGIYPRLIKKISKKSFFSRMNKKIKELAKSFRPENGFLKTITYHTYAHRLKEMFGIARLE